MLFDMEKEREGLERGFIPQNLLLRRRKVWGCGEGRVPVTFPCEATE